MSTVTDIEVIDVRFPTSRQLDGSDAMNPDPDYSAAYVVLETDTAGLEGHGLTFTIGRGNEICVAAIAVASSRDKRKLGAASRHIAIWLKRRLPSINMAWLASRPVRPCGQIS